MRLKESVRWTILPLFSVIRFSPHSALITVTYKLLEISSNLLSISIFVFFPDKMACTKIFWPNSVPINAGFHCISDVSIFLLICILYFKLLNKNCTYTFLQPLFIRLNSIPMKFKITTVFWPWISENKTTQF